MKTMEVTYKVTFTNVISSSFTTNITNNDYCVEVFNSLVKERISRMPDLVKFEQSIKLGIRGMSIDNIENVYDNSIMSIDACYIHITWSVEDSVSSLDEINKYFISIAWVWCSISKIEVIRFTRYVFKSKTLSRPLMTTRPINMPCWYNPPECNEEYVTIICYLPEGVDLMKYWDDAYDISSEEKDIIEYSETFSKPFWLL